MDPTHRQNVLSGINSVVKTSSYYLISYKSGETARVQILNSHVVRYYMSPSGVFLDYPVPRNTNDNAKITSKTMDQYGLAAFRQSTLSETYKKFTIHANKIEIIFDKAKATMKVYDKRTNKVVLRELEPLSYANGKQTQTLGQNVDEFYYGGGMQNGRFSHKGNLILIQNTNDWVDQGISSPCPFYWSTNGYGVLRNTWTDGIYDFGNDENTSYITTTHEETNSSFDAFYFINPKGEDILKDYYELTGLPILLPDYAYYEAHLNEFNRNIWVKVESCDGILFEDGFYYKAYKPNSGKVGILQSLNGENNNYQFSARAMIDRYKRYDMPLGWFIPNDGYGSGYGQTDTLDGDIQNLLQFTDYAKENGVEVALWTESQLTPVDPSHPKKGDRDLRKEVAIAGITALKCDVAWVGEGYSFAHNAVENVSKIFKKHSPHNHRLFMIMVCGWAGTQRLAGIWSGDQYGGGWEYIRFHIPTYIGTGLSGLPVFGSDMDGIYGGGDKYVNIRDYQWKTFTPLQLNMDGWGTVPKYPFSFDDEAINIKRAYLKLKSMLMPYNYTIGHETQLGLPMVRAMFLEFPSDIFAYTVGTQYQYMWGPSILVAPVYEDKEVRNDIYLPDKNQVWIDFFTGKRYKGGCVLNNFPTPLWKIPVFIRDGAIIPNVEPNNNVNEINKGKRMFLIYPCKDSEFVVYEDDGRSSDYLYNLYATTKVIVRGPNSIEDKIYISIDKTKGYYKNMIKERSTVLQIMTPLTVDAIKVAVNDVSLEISEAKSEKDFNKQKNVYYVDNEFEFNPYMTHVKQGCLLLKLQKMDVTKTEIRIKIFGSYHLERNFKMNKAIKVPDALILKRTTHSITLQWTSTGGDFYDVEMNGQLFTNLLCNQHVFENLKSDTEYSFRIRSVHSSESAVSNWSHTFTCTTNEMKTIKVASVICSVPSQNNQNIENLLKDNSKWWHTVYDLPNQASILNETMIKVDFDLGEIYNVDKIEYNPREDGGNGTILKLKYMYSLNGVTWKESSIIKWESDNLTKTLQLNGIECRFFNLLILESEGGFGSGRSMLFYKM